MIDFLSLKMAETNFLWPRLEGNSQKTIEDIPDEVLDYILALVSAYGDLRNCCLVSRRWREAVHRVSRNHGLSMEKAVPDMKLVW